MIKIIVCLLVALCCVSISSRAAAAAPSSHSIDFGRDIRPILSDNCFTCHGPDDAKRKAGLRLDRREDAFKPAKSGDRAIVPGNPGESELLRRITAEDEDDRMPPVKTGKKLTAHQIDLVRRWIQEGAPWQTHWAFVAPVRPEVPKVRDDSWPRNDIDRFVLARLEREELKPSPEADKATIIRRASLDTTGLPPTVEEVDAFLADGSSDAYERLVDRLLSSPRYGEHMARYWLDAVRYADTHGYHIDSRRDIWKYRDWVIQAFNDNKPFDQFATEQLAGDLLPNPTLDQKIATGYVRANMTTGEGGVIEDEYRAKYTFDRVETTGTVFLGMTLTCARCHSHKYDPILQHEYYGLYAIFNQVADPVMDENKPNPAPFLKVPSKEQSERLAWLQAHIESGQAQLTAARPGMDQAQREWEQSWRDRLSLGWTTLLPAIARATATNGAHLAVLGDNSILAEGPNPESDVHEFVFRPPIGQIGALRLESLPDGSLPGHGCGRGMDGAFALSGFEAELAPPAKDGADSKPGKLTIARAVADAEVKGHEIGRALDGDKESGWQVPTNALREPHTALFVFRKPVQIEPGTELKVRLRYETGKAMALGRIRLSAGTGAGLLPLLHPPGFEPWQVLGPLKAKEPRAALLAVQEPEQALDLKRKYPGVREEVGWTERPDLGDGRANLLVQDLHGIHGVRYLYRTLTLPQRRTLDLQVRADGLFRLWVNGELVGERDHEEAPGEGPLQLTVQLKAGENRFLFKIVTVQGASYFAFTPDLGSPDTLTDDVATILAASSAMTPENAWKVRLYYRETHSLELRKISRDLALWREEQATLDRSVPTTLIAKESETPRETFLLQRGEYDKHGEKVTPHLPAIFPPIPAGQATNRLGLARWLFSPSHPLTARVTVNRLWQQTFGIGLVKTTEDFGMQGEAPSHPELLDWLATEFIRSGWNIKHLQRLILTSATYRQTSRASPELVSRDPENRLLARGPRFRMDGEVVRDTALYVSGLLIEKPGGRSVRPYEPPGLWEAVSFNNSQRYVQDTGDAQYRRSLYTFWKRQSPPPNMLIFDAPSRESCTVRRSRSNTPLQALVLLNDPQFVEAARAFAGRILAQGGSCAQSRLTYACRLATGHQPSRGELAVLERVFDQQQAEYCDHPDAAEQLLSQGPAPLPPQGKRAEVGAWTVVASLILNLDATVTKN